MCLECQGFLTRVERHSLEEAIPRPTRSDAEGSMDPFMACENQTIVSALLHTLRAPRANRSVFRLSGAFIIHGV